MYLELFMTSMTSACDSIIECQPQRLGPLVLSPEISLDHYRVTLKWYRESTDLNNLKVRQNMKPLEQVSKDVVAKENFLLSFEGI